MTNIKNLPNNLLWFIPIGALLLSFFHLSIWYYTFLKIIITTTAGYLIYLECYTRTMQEEILFLYGAAVAFCYVSIARIIVLPLESMYAPIEYIVLLKLTASVLLAGWFLYKQLLKTDQVTIDMTELKETPIRIIKEVLVVVILFSLIALIFNPLSTLNPNHLLKIPLHRYQWQWVDICTLGIYLSHYFYFKRRSIFVFIKYK